MKLCDLALFSPETSSGVKTYIEAKIEYVRRRDDVEHVVIVPGEEDRATIEGRSKIVIVRGVRCFYPGLRIGVNLPKIAALVEAESPDLIELNCQYTLPWAAFLATRRRRTPIVGVYHTDVPACARHLARHTGRTLSSAVERLTAFYEGLIYRHCSRTVVLNPAMAGSVRRLGVERISCLPCGVDAATFNPARRDEGYRERLGITAGQTVIVYAGRLSKEKELDVLFAAKDLLPSRRFVLLVAGDGPEAESVRRRAATHPGVLYLGDITSREDLATACASSDVFVMPGRYETFGMATLEALSCGLPVVGIEGCGTAVVVPPHLGQLVRAGDALGLASAISAVSAWEPEALRDAGHSYAADNFSWSRVLDQYFDLYSRLIETVQGEAA